MAAGNFAVENDIRPHCNFKTYRIMSILIMLLIIPAWFLQALKDGGKTK